MSITTKLYIAGALALIAAGIYIDRKYVQAGGASGIAFDVADTIWNNAAGAVANTGASVWSGMTTYAGQRLADQQAKAPQVQSGIVMPFPTSAWDVIPAGL
ncbi:hypothetical protein [Burkholderia stagnalis]|uniref:hypothetical protein n=1 Tax=Burkholderia stagnalis TaxID=1503054 RepID=UPI000F55A9C1|nr:hypothetical protein [Burkholderia stagnalis]RQQ65542.1 hypothetical protein DF137_22425 [Burkholderia stagnalis]RQQ78176.1 hypothetical protein DF138_21720 [Burkholderia stagnalis]RQQ87779.1 hypothetical protein DF136_21390 [Burkholderia stagnalis]